MSEKPIPAVCVVTHLLAAASERVSLNLVEILSALSTVSLITANVPAESRLH